MKHRLLLGTHGPVGDVDDASLSNTAKALCGANASAMKVYRAKKALEASVLRHMEGYGVPQYTKLRTTIPAETTAKVRQFWCAQTAPNASARDRVLVKRIISGGVEISHPKHIQTCSTLEMHSKYNRENPGYPVTRFYFRQERPWWVTKSMTWNLCQCIICLHFRWILNGIVQGDNFMSAFDLAQYIHFFNYTSTWFWTYITTYANALNVNIHNQLRNSGDIA